MDIMETFDKLVQLNPWQYFIVIGLAISGVAALLTTYNTLSKINDEYHECRQTPALADKTKTRFVVVLILSALAFAAGVALAYYTRNSDKHVMPLALIVGGILGVLWAVMDQFQDSSDGLKLGISWTSLLLFLLLGYLSDWHHAGFGTVTTAAVQ